MFGDRLWIPDQIIAPDEGQLRWRTFPKGILSIHSQSPQDKRDGADSIIFGVFCDQHLSVSFPDPQSEKCMGYRVPDQFDDLIQQLSPEERKEGRIHVVSKDRDRLAALIELLEREFAIAPERIFAHGTWGKLTMNVDTGEFYYGESPPSVTLDMSECSLIPQMYTIDELRSDACRYWHEEAEDLLLSEDEIPRYAEQWWSSLIPESEREELFSSAPEFLANVSVAEKRRAVSRLNCVLELLEGKENRAGHVIALDGKEYVILNAPHRLLTHTETIPSIKVPAGSILGWNEENLSRDARLTERVYSNDLSSHICMIAADRFHL